MAIIWSPEARRDLDEIFASILAENPSVAVAVLDRIEEKVLLLAEYPAAGRAGRVMGTRELVVSDYPYVIPYRVKADQVEIIRVLHGARRWPPSEDLV